MSNQLIEYLSDHLISNSDSILDAFVNEINSELGDAVLAIVFYGSCLRTHEYDNAMLDFYVVVDDYRNCYSSRLEGIVNAVLPPNVYFCPTHVKDKKYASKYAVITLKHLYKEVSENAFHPYFWARFCQPISTIFIKSEQVRKDILSVQATAIQTFLNATQCNEQAPESAKNNVEALWVRGFELTYAAELRAESKGRAQYIFENNRDFYAGISHTLVSSKDQVITQDNSKSLARFKYSWRLRNILGRCLSILRLFKASFTFKNGVDYIAWKIERHTGTKIAVTPRLRRFPWIFAWPILYKLLSKRTIK